MLGTILLIFLVLLVIGAFAGRSHPAMAPYGWYPGAGLGLILVVVVILLVLGRL